ncbi:tRNA (guanosine(37)-N1)-methyltransferase TrmD [Candidatus Ishikawella capsulata]|nr:tRNA (guanosine(37)-N1)-methyltransferase TrmD [Candidatus Ishikawaella capsulata]
MRIGIISLFERMFDAITKYGIIGRAVKHGQLQIKIWNPRNFTSDNYRSVDSPPYGGGPGMLMMPQPLKQAIQAAKLDNDYDGYPIKVIYLSAQGKKLTQNTVRKLASYKRLILVCGRYKGIDERVIESEIDEELSIGDYVLSGGELPAMVLIDSVARYIPGIVGTAASLDADSFSQQGLLDCPHYTRPAVLEGMEVPSVLLSGNHKNIYYWRLKQSLGRTWLRRPKLLQSLPLTSEQLKLLMEFQRDYQNKSS